MQASHRPRDLDRLDPSRRRQDPRQPQNHGQYNREQEYQRGHAPQISISDTNHHVTDAIGSMYGDDDDEGQSQQYHSQGGRNRGGRPLSFVPSPLGDSIEQQYGQAPGQRGGGAGGRPGVLRTPSAEKSRGYMGGDSGSYTRPTNTPTSPQNSYERTNGYSASSPKDSGIGSGSTTPTSLNRSPSEASQHFPMTDLDSQADIAQELSNLQAIRRMSMGMGTEAAADPDLPSFASGMHIPSVAPAHDADEQDPAHMFWVPASVHPELAPKAFESFIQDRVKTIKRSSLSMSSDASPGSSLAPADSRGLSRKKSMLSRQVNDGSGYQDGAERLERKRSSMHRDGGALPSLQELEDVAQDPSSLMRRLSIDQAKRNSLEGAPEGAEGGDMPILPPKPMGQGLKRSTKTTYRRGSQRKGERLAGRRGLAGATEGEDKPPALPALPKTDEIPQLPAFTSDLGFGNFEPQGLQRVQTEPTPPKPSPSRAVENFSRPGRKAISPPVEQQEFSSYGDARPTSPPTEHERKQQSPSPESHMYPPRGSSARSPPPHMQSMQVPTINVEQPSSQQDQHGRPYSAPSAGMQRPERVQSLDQASAPPSQPPSQPLPNRPSRPALNRPASLQHARQGQGHAQTVPQPGQKTTFDALGVQAQPQTQPQSQPQIPSQSTRTSDLSIIPTYETEKKAEAGAGKKGKDKKDDGTRKSSWSWLTGDKEKEAEKGAKGKQSKLQRPVEAAPGRHDDTRLDVLQTQIDGGKPRESLVLDRSSIQVEQPVQKAGGRKTSTEDKKKEKDTGLFSSLFGGKKKGADKEGASAKKAANSSLRGLSPEPPARRLQPDIDYNWSRFSILEERAIYRMAHIKLANPRRELYSQVLLSNFMYSYLAKVQQMHPQMQVPQSAAQKKAAKQEEERKRRQVEQERQAQAAQQAGGGDGDFGNYQRFEQQQAASTSNQQPPSNGNHNQAHPPPRSGSLIDSARNAPPKQSRQDQNQNQDDADAQLFSQYTQQYSNSSPNSNGGHHNQHYGHHQSQQDFYDYDDGSSGGGGGGGGGKKKRGDWM